MLCLDCGTISTAVKSLRQPHDEVRLIDTTVLNAAGIERQPPPGGVLFAPDSLVSEVDGAAVFGPQTIPTILRACAIDGPDERHLILLVLPY